MRMTKMLNRRSKTTEYFKHMISIPKKHLNELEWDENTELKMRVSGGKLIMEKEWFYVQNGCPM